MEKFKVVVWCDSDGCFCGSAEVIGSDFELWDAVDRAARRPKPIFEKDLSEPTPKLVEQLERLRQVEKRILKGLA